MAATVALFRPLDYDVPMRGGTGRAGHLPGCRPHPRLGHHRARRGGRCWSPASAGLLRRPGAPGHAHHLRPDRHRRRRRLRDHGVDLWRTRARAGRTRPSGCWPRSCARRPRTGASCSSRPSPSAAPRRSCWHLDRLLTAGQIPHLPLYLDSPMASLASDIYHRYPGYYDEETFALLQAGETPLDFPGAQATTSPASSRAIQQAPRPLIIVASSGMLTGGRVVFHLRELVDDPDALLLFVGYQGEGTLGAHLQAGARRIHLDGAEREVRCQVRSISGFSAHADESELLDWLGTLAGGTRRPRTRLPRAWRSGGPRRARAEGPGHGPLPVSTVVARGGRAGLSLWSAGAWMGSRRDRGSGPGSATGPLSRSRLAGRVPRWAAGSAACEAPAGRRPRPIHRGGRSRVSRPTMRMPRAL